MDQQQINTTGISNKLSEHIDYNIIGLEGNALKGRKSLIRLSYQEAFGVVYSAIVLT